MQMPSYPGCEGASYPQIMHDFRGICVLRNNVLDNEERSPRANFQLSISGKATLLLLPGGVGVNLCSSMWHPFKQLGTVRGRGNQSETHKRVSKNNIIR